MKIIKSNEIKNDILKNIKYCNSDNNFLLINHTNKVDIDLKNIFINIEKEVSLWD